MDVFQIRIHQAFGEDTGHGTNFKVVGKDTSHGTNFRSFAFKLVSGDTDQGVEL